MVPIFKEQVVICFVFQGVQHYRIYLYFRQLTTRMVSRLTEERPDMAGRRVVWLRNLKFDMEVSKIGGDRDMCKTFTDSICSSRNINETVMKKFLRVPGFTSGISGVTVSVSSMVSTSPLCGTSLEHLEALQAVRLRKCVLLGDEEHLPIFALASPY